MDVPGFVGVVTAAIIFVSLIMLAGVCLHCRNKGPLVSIRQGHASEEYIQSPGFRLAHTYQQAPDMLSNNPSSLSPFSPLVDLSRRSFTPTENESNPSYENPPDGSDRQDQEIISNSSYISVLPDSPKVEVPLSISRQDSTSSSDDEGKYENVPKSNYLNVELIHSLGPAARESERESDSSSSSSDDEGNYVNQPSSHYDNLSDL
ncbi:uncharacterized protein LOC142992355 [Genypterus blacodes]|uniref:uncharacterized protein LOC142992355 n=1 Tax=Genypterus blacodes TaxID=154954 RepID=UPI003F76FC1B